MTVRSIKFQLEAKLKAASGGFFSKPQGKLERKSYGDMTERLKITVRNLKVQDNSVAIITSDGKELIELPIISGRGKYDEESNDASTFPALEPGQKIEVSVDGNIVLSGKLYVD